MEAILQLAAKGRFPAGTVGFVEVQHDPDCPYPKSRARCTCKNGPDLRIVTEEVGS